MQDVCDFLYKEDFLNKKYDWRSDNCQHFADAFYGRCLKDTKDNMSHLLLAMHDVIGLFLGFCR